MSDLEKFLDDAWRNEEEFMAVVDGNDPEPLIYSSRADDGSPLGTEGFANLYGYYTSRDDITEAWLPKEGQEVGLVTDSQRTEELIQHEEDRRAGIKADALRAKRNKTAYNRRVLEDQYERVIGTKPEKMTMKAMREELNAHYAKSRLSTMSELGSIMRGFGF